MSVTMTTTTTTKRQKPVPQKPAIKKTAAHASRASRASHTSDGLFTVEEAAARLGISRRNLQYKISREEIEYIKVGRLTRISIDALRAYTAAHRHSAR